MYQAMVPLVASAIFAFAVHRWISDELERERRLSSAAGNAAMALGVLLTSLVLVVALGGVARVDVGGPAAVAAGIALALAGVTLAACAVWALGSRERLLGMRLDDLVAKGPYRYARHPFYLGWAAALVGVAIAGGSLVALGLAVLIGIALVRVARGEERFLCDEVGAEYGSYRSGAPPILGRPRPTDPSPGVAVEARRPASRSGLP
jgi:protein-S-isoprenylcysteine O-methyltransferase Ste14